MPRPRKCRKVGFVPANILFYPEKNSEESVVLSIEEIEALRLSDLILLDQDSAAKSMDVSRGTFQRILNSARYKCSDGIINGKNIIIDGGNYKYDENICCCRNRLEQRDCKLCGKCTKKD